VPANPYPVSQSNRNLTILAWVLTILISLLPDILWTELTHSPAAWFTFAKMVVLFGLALTVFLWGPLRPLRNFFAAMIAFFGLSELRLRFNFTWPALQHLFGGNVFDVRMQAEQTGKLFVSLAMIATLLVLGLKRREFFLTPGNVRAPIEPVRWLGFARPVSWISFGRRCTSPPGWSWCSIWVCGQALPWR
jgi:hypothetical protein